MPMCSRGDRGSRPRSIIPSRGFAAGWLTRTADLDAVGNREHYSPRHVERGKRRAIAKSDGLSRSDQNAPDRAAIRFGPEAARGTHSRGTVGAGHRVRCLPRLDSGAHSLSALASRGDHRALLRLRAPNRCEVVHTDGTYVAAAFGKTSLPSHPGVRLFSRIPPALRRLVRVSRPLFPARAVGLTPCYLFQS